MKWIFWLQLQYLVLLLAAKCPVAATEIKYTDTDGQDQGPLPLSQAQRNQLTQLDQAIQQSPDPQATLLKVAQANNMDPQDLINMLERNRADMAQGGGMTHHMQGWPQKVAKLMTAMGILLSQLAAKNPKSFSIVALTLLFLFYVGINAPRNGLVISSHSSLFSKGHTTWWLPPPKYVDRMMESRRFSNKIFSIPEHSQLLDLRKDAGDVVDVHHKDGIQWHSKLGRKSTLKSFAVAQITILVDNMIPEMESTLDENDHAEEDLAAIRDDVAHILFEEAALSVMSSRRFSEFTENKVRLQSSKGDRTRSGVLVLPKSGDWGRYGLQPLKIVHQSEGTGQSQITYSTLKGGVVDAQIHIVVKQSNSGNVIVRVEALVPRKGRKLRKQHATLMVSSLCSSIARSIQTEANVRLARQVQGKRYAENAKARAVQRRRFRIEKEKELEEMAQDRRRRWQRGNPDAGRYRPSGHRLKSPNNC